jgi:hypothetical protein
MDYKQDQSPDPEIPCAAEPAVAYAARGPVTREPWETAAADDDDDFDFDFGIDDFGGKPAPDGYETWADWQIENIPEVAAEFDRIHLESEADIAAGRVYTQEEIEREFEWRIANDYWDDVIERLKKNGWI